MCHECQGPGKLGTQWEGGLCLDVWERYRICDSISRWLAGRGMLVTLEEFFFKLFEACIGQNSGSAHDALWGGARDQSCTSFLSDSDLGDHKLHYRTLMSRRHEERRTGSVSEKMVKAGRQSGWRFDTRTQRKASYH